MDKTNIFWGKVIKGKQRGRSLGFPTANTKLHKNIRQGIYISKAVVSQKKYPALTFIGNSKTFGEYDVKTETYFLDANPNLYGEWMSVSLIKKIRVNKKFNSKKELIAQMKKDLQKVKKYFKI